MKTVRIPPRRPLEGYHPPLQVSRFIASKPADAERGSMVWMRASEARIRMLQDGELVWVFGPHRHELAQLTIDDEVPRGYVVARDVAGIAAAEIVRIVKPDLEFEHRQAARV